MVSAGFRPPALFSRMMQPASTRAEWWRLILVNQATPSGAEHADVAGLEAASFPLGLSAGGGSEKREDENKRDTRDSSMHSVQNTRKTRR